MEDSSGGQAKKTSGRRSRIVPEMQPGVLWKPSSNGRIMIPTSGVDIFAVLPVNSSSNVSNEKGRSSRNSLDSQSTTPRALPSVSSKARRSSFEFQIPTPTGVKRSEGMREDNSGITSRRSMDVTIPSATPPPVAETVARLKSMSSFRDNSIPTIARDRSFIDATLTRDRSFKDATLTRDRSFKDATLTRDRSFRDREPDRSSDQGHRSARIEKTPLNAPARMLSNLGITIPRAEDAEQDKFDNSGFQDRSLETQLVEDRKRQRRANPGPALPSGGAIQRPARAKLNFSLLFTNKIGPSLISEHIVLGGRDDAADKNLMRNLGITHVLNVAQQLSNSFEGSFIYLKLNIIDNIDVDLTPFIKQALAFIRHVENIGGRVLVHCVAGVSRSVSMILFHLMTNHRINLVNAYNHLKQQRPFIKPNDGFKIQLAKYELTELGFSSVVEKSAGPDWDFYGINNIKASLSIKSAPPAVRAKVPTRSQRFGKSSTGAQSAGDNCKSTSTQSGLVSSFDESGGWCVIS